MKFYSPKYYKSFKCTADKCTHSCCVGWEIDIDEDTLSLYRALDGGYGEEVKNSISYEDMPHFKLLSDERCPHLDEKGLCRIILSLGEDHLCHICREHPRFYNYAGDRTEVGLGMACEEACRIILSSDDYGVEGGAAPLPETVRIREGIYSLISDTSLPYAARLDTVYSRYGVCPSVISDVRWKNLLSSLEYMDPSHKDAFSCYSSAVVPMQEHEDVLRRALAYFIYRHCTEAFTAEEYRACLGFCLFCERLFASLLYAEKPEADEDIIRIARTLSEEIEYSEDNTDTVKSIFYS